METLPIPKDDKFHRYLRERYGSAGSSVSFGLEEPD
jgi:hypothetical protein